MNEQVKTWMNEQVKAGPYKHQKQGLVHSRQLQVTQKPSDDELRDHLLDFPQIIQREDRERERARTRERTVHLQTSISHLNTATHDLCIGISLHA